MYLDTAGFGPVQCIDYQYFVAANSGYKSKVTGNRPAFEMRHLVNWQLLFAFTVVIKNTFYTSIKIP